MQLSEDNLEKKKLVRKASEAIYAMGPGPRQWKAVQALHLKRNNIQSNGLTAQEEHALVIADVKRQKETRKNAFASSDSNSWRWAVRIPASLWTMLELFDPMIADPKEGPSATKLAQVFKEYSVPERI